MDRSADARAVRSVDCDVLRVAGLVARPLGTVARAVTSDERLISKTNGTAFAAGTTSRRAYKP
jgi:hypothetical protein